MADIRSQRNEERNRTMAQGRGAAGPPAALLTGFRRILGRGVGLRRGALYCVLAVPAAAAVLSTVVLLGRPETAVHDPATLAERAATAIAVARGAGAATRAPVAFARAEEAYAVGLVERRRHQLRFAPFRNYDSARASLARATAYGEAAANLARSAATQERRRSLAALSRTLDGLSALDGVEDRVWLTREVRGRLQRARSLALEASSLLAGGNYGLGEARALEGNEQVVAVSRSVQELTRRYTDADSLRMWRRWLDETVDWSAQTGKTVIVIFKDEHRVTLYERGRPVRMYQAELGWNNVSRKIHQHDGATPEGRYQIVDMKERGRSRHHRALLLDYPNQDDLRALKALKRAGAAPVGVSPGGLIEIHGGGGQGKDWTDGCVALTNAEVDELFGRVSVGTPVIIVGSHDGDGVFGSLARSLERRPD